MSAELEAAPKMGFLDRVAGVFYEPRAVFANLAHRPDIVFPLILVAISTILTAIMTLRMDLSAYLPPEQLQAAAAVPKLVMALGGAMGVLAAVGIGWVLRSAVFYGLGKALGGDGKFRAVLSTQGYVMLPYTLGVLLTAIFAVQTGRPVTLAASHFLPLAEQAKPLGILLAQVSPFILGYLLLAPVAVSESMSLSRRKSAILVFACWLLAVLFQLGGAMIGAALQGG